MEIGEEFGRADAGRHGFGFPEEDAGLRIENHGGGPGDATAFAGIVEIPGTDRDALRIAEQRKG